MSRHPDKQQQKGISDYRTGNLPAIIVLIVLVITSLVLVLTLPGQFSPQSLALTETADLIADSTSTPGPVTTETAITPVQVVNIDGIVLLGGVMLLLVLFAVLREIVWRQRHD